MHVTDRSYVRNSAAIPNKHFDNRSNKCIVHYKAIKYFFKIEAKQ